MMTSKMRGTLTGLLMVLAAGADSVAYQTLTAQAPEAPRVRTDGHGDPLPEGAIRRFGTLRFRRHGMADLAFTPDGKKLIAGGGGGSLLVFDAVTGRRLLELGGNTPQTRNLMGFAVSPDGKRVAGCGSDVFLWDLETGRLIRSFFFNDRYKEVVFSPDGTKIAAIKEVQRGGDYQLGIVIGDTATGRHAEDWFLHQGDQIGFGFGGLAFSPDGKFLAGTFAELREARPAIHESTSTYVWLLDAATGKRVRTIGSAKVPVVCFAFQPGSGRLATYGKDGLIRFWDVATGKEVRRFQAAKGPEGNGFGSLRFSADGKRCAVLTDRAKFLTVLDAEDGRVIRRIEGRESRLAVAVALSADGETVASARRYEESCVRVWDVATGAERLAGADHRAAVTALSLSADDRTLISGDSEGQQIRWDRQTGKSEVHSTGRREEIGRFDWSRDYSRKTLLGPRWRMVYKNQRPATMEVWSLDGAKLIGKWESHATTVPTVALSPDGKQLAIAVQHFNPNYEVMLWEPQREEKPRFLPGHPKVCWELVFSPDGKWLIGTSGFNQGNSNSGSLWTWDLRSTPTVRQASTQGIPNHVLTGDDRIVLTGSGWEDARVQAWDLETGRERAHMTVPGLKPVPWDSRAESRPAIAGLALSADKRFLAVVSRQDDASHMSIWETGSWKLIRAFAPLQPRNEVKALLFSRDGRSLFAANSDSTILEWDASDRLANGRSHPADKTLKKDRLNVLWQTLAETPDKAYPAVWEMLDHPAESVRFLSDKLVPIGPMEEKRWRQLLARLDSDSFAEREEASRQLLTLGQQLVPMLRQALNDRPSLEMRKRLERIVESLNRGPTPDQLRLLRALAVLEWSGGPEADKHLRRLADGVPSASLTQAAKAALRRLGHFSSPRKN